MLLLLLLPHQQDALVDEDVLLLHTGGTQASGGRPRGASVASVRLSPHLGLNHGETVRAHLRHHSQNIHKLVFSDVLHQTVQSDEGPRPAHSRTAHSPLALALALAC